MLSFTDYFGISDGMMMTVMETAMSRGADYSDIFLEHTVENQLTMEEGIVKEGVKSVSYTHLTLPTNREV